MNEGGSRWIKRMNERGGRWIKRMNKGKPIGEWHIFIHS